MLMIKTEKISQNDETEMSGKSGGRSDVIERIYEVVNEVGLGKKSRQVIDL